MIRFAVAVFVTFALAGFVSAQEPTLSGKWDGYWISDKNGHQGPLHGRFRQIDSNTYRVAFHGRFAKVIPFWYTTKLHVEGTGDGVVVLGASQNSRCLASIAPRLQQPTRHSTQHSPRERTPAASC